MEWIDGIKWIEKEKVGVRETERQRDIETEIMRRTEKYTLRMLLRHRKVELGRNREKEEESYRK